MSLIKVRDLSYSYSNSLPTPVAAISDVNIDIESGEIIGVIGHTGSGKSTLIQMFNGLLKPQAGRVLLDGTDIWEKPKGIRKIRFRVGLVMQ